MAVVFSTSAAVTNSAGNTARRVKLHAARSNEQYLSFIAVVCLGFSVEMSAGKFLLANAPSILPRMSRHPGNGKKKFNNNSQPSTVLS